MHKLRKIILMCSILLLMEIVAGFLLEPVTYQHTLEQDLKVMEEQGWQPNMVLLGDSMVSCGLVPAALEETLGEDFCVLNAGTASQQVWGSYYYLKDLLNEYDIQYTVIGVDQWAFTQQDKGIKRDLLVLNRLKTPKIKLEYVVDIFEPEEYPYLLKSYANRDGFSNIGKNLKQKLTGKYLFEDKRGSKKKDLSRGHTGNGAGMGRNEAGIPTLDEFKKENIDQRAVTYLKKS